jgi:hypothetical protein
MQLSLPATRTFRLANAIAVVQFETLAGGEEATTVNFSTRPWRARSQTQPISHRRPTTSGRVTRYRGRPGVSAPSATATEQCSSRSRPGASIRIEASADLRPGCRTVLENPTGTVLMEPCSGLARAITALSNCRDRGGRLPIATAGMDLDLPPTALLLLCIPSLYSPPGTVSCRPGYRPAPGASPQPRQPAPPMRINLLVE